jgi:hypothetical protein
MGSTAFGFKASANGQHLKSPCTLTLNITSYFHKHVRWQLLSPK